MSTPRSVFVVCLVALCIANFASADWWDSANFYQIYPRSFKDSDGDGIGDLRGITDKLPYLKSIGVTGTWLSPIFSSPMADFGYDISDFKNISSIFGTMADFDNLVARCKELDIKLILDFVPNHTSDEHQWFINSANNVSGYEDFYIWHPGYWNETTKKHDPPNNWLSAFKFSGWEWNESRYAFYLHQFVAKQPDLNYRNPTVVEEMKDVLRFWMSRGVAGFRIDAVPHLFEIAPAANGSLPNEPLSGTCTDDPDLFCYLNHIYTQNQPETFDMMYQWRAVMDQFKTDNGGDTRILMTEAYTSLDYLMQFYKEANGTRLGSHIPFNFQLLLNLNSATTGRQVKVLIDSWLTSMPTGTDFHANWVLGNHDNHRLASRLGKNRIDLFNIMLKTLPGVAITYMGEELGMTNVHVSWKDTVDPQACNTNDVIWHENSRDPARTPFQWDATLYSGFSTTSPTAKPWLPVSPNYKNINVAAQELSPRSHLKVFRKLIEARKSVSLQNGTYVPYMVNDNVLVYQRATTNFSPFVVVLNFGTTTTLVNLKELFPTLATNITVVTSSILSQYKDGAVVPSNAITIKGEHGVLFTT